MLRSHLVSYRAFACVATLPLVLCSLVGWSARTDDATASAEEHDVASLPEMVADNTRPSWENNLNWWMDGNDALVALQRMPGTGEISATRPATASAELTDDSRMTRVAATRDGNARVAANRSDGLPVRGAERPTLWALLAFVAAWALFASALLRPRSPSGSDSARKPTWLVPGLERWLSDRELPDDH
jgi:hypothetical protein